LSTNLDFISVRKFSGLEWEVFKDNSRKKFVAICHSNSETVESYTWDGVWEAIMERTRSLNKRQQKVVSNE